MTAYPQKPPLTQDELAAFLNEAPIARLSSINPDETIHMAATYFKYDNGDILIGTQDITHKIRNLKNNPNVTVLIDSQESPFRGFSSMVSQFLNMKMLSQNVHPSLNATCLRKMRERWRLIWQVDFRV